MLTTPFLYFFLYASLGWICESIYVSIFRRKIINSGFLHGPICPIYGFGAVFIIWLLTPLSAYPLFVFLLGMISTSILEYFTSWLMEVLFHMRWWDYSKHRFHIHGRVCLLNSTLFGIMSVLVLYIIHPVVIDVIGRFSYQTQVFFTILCLVLFLLDFMISTWSVLRMNKSLQQIHAYLHELYETNMQPFLEKIDIEERVLNRLESTKKRLQHVFPTLRHDFLDVTLKNIEEIKNKTRKK